MCSPDVCVPLQQVIRPAPNAEDSINIKLNVLERNNGISPPVLNYVPLHEHVLGSGGLVRCILKLNTR